MQEDQVRALWYVALGFSKTIQDLHTPTFHSLSCCVCCIFGLVFVFCAQGKCTCVCTGTKCIVPPSLAWKLVPVSSRDACRGAGHSARSAQSFQQLLAELVAEPLLCVVAPRHLSSLSSSFTRRLSRRGCSAWLLRESYIISSSSLSQTLQRSPLLSEVGPRCFIQSFQQVTAELAAELVGRRGYSATQFLSRQCCLAELVAEHPCSARLLRDAWVYIYNSLFSFKCSSKTLSIEPSHSKTLNSTLFTSNHTQSLPNLSNLHEISLVCQGMSFVLLFIEFLP